MAVLVCLGAAEDGDGRDSGARPRRRGSRQRGRFGASGFDSFGEDKEEEEEELVARFDSSGGQLAATARRRTRAGLGHGGAPEREGERGTGR